jgi:hypothetical protein
MLMKLRAFSALCGAALSLAAIPAQAQDRLPWLRDDPAPYRSAPAEVERDSLPPAYGSSAPRAGETYAPPPSGSYGSNQGYGSPGAGSGYDRRGDVYRPPAPAPRYDEPPAYEPPRPPYRADDRDWREPPRHASSERSPYRHDRRYDPEPEPRDGTFSMREIVDAGHGFFGSVSQGLASVIEYAFKRQGRPNGYILGEDLGGAFVAGLRYGEGRLYTRDAGTHRVYWQGPSIGYDAGAEGSKVMVLVYRLRDPDDIYQRFGGVAGSAYVVGGVGLTFQQRDNIVLAPIRAGLGLRLGANVGYLKYTRRPTWNPF